MDIEASIGLRLDALAGHMRKMHEEQAEANVMVRELVRGVKGLRMPLVMGTASGSALTMGGDTGVALSGPDQGYVWSVRHLVIEGMTSGATPDVMNVLRGSRIVWQLNGNQFCQTFGRGEMLLFPGETLTYTSVGTFASTAKIIAHGLAENLPAEMIGKLY